MLLSVNLIQAMNVVGAQYAMLQLNLLSLLADTG